MASVVRQLITVWGFRVNTAPLKRAEASVAKLKTGINALNAVTLAVGAGFAAAGFGIGKFLKDAGEFELVEESFNTLLESTEKGKKILGEIVEFTKRSPFRFEDTVRGAKKLLAFDIEADKLIRTLEALGNIAFLVGRERLPFLVLALGQVKTKGKLRGQEIRQFAEAGVGIVKEILKLRVRPQRK